MKSVSVHSVVPQGELRCQWMDAGVIEYKLCDKQFRCEECELDLQIRNRCKTKINEQAISLPSTESSAKILHSQNSNESIFHSIVEDRLAAFSTKAVPDDRLYHRNHMWMLQQEKGTYRIGIDALVAGLLQPVISIVISRVPTEINRLDPCCWIILSEGAISFRSPVDGMVLRFNPAIVHKPTLLTSDPFGEGWLLEMSIKSRAKGLSDFFPVDAYRKTRDRNLHILQNQFHEAYKQNYAHIGATLNDGGTMVTNIETALGEKIYFEIISRIFESHL